MQSVVRCGCGCGDPVELRKGQCVLVEPVMTERWMIPVRSECYAILLRVMGIQRLADDEIRRRKATTFP